MSDPTKPIEVPPRAEDHTLKLSAIRQALGEAGLTGVLINTTHVFAWATSGGRNFVPLNTAAGVAALWVSLDHVAVITSCIEGNRIMAEELAGLSGIELVMFDWWEPKSMGQVIADKRWAEPGSWESDEGPVMGPKLDALRTSLGLTPREMAVYRLLGRDCGAAIGEVARSVRAGDTEYALAGRLLQACARLNIDTVACMVAADARMDSCRHPLPTAQPVKHRVMLVLCGRREGLIASVTRCVHMGAPSEDLAARHHAVCNVDATAIAATYAGNTCDSIFAEIKEAYAKNGFEDEWKLHHQGGMAGYKSREFKATPSCTHTVAPHQAYAWNPSIAGTKSEDTIIVGPEGEPAIITPTPGWPMINCNVGGTIVKTNDGTVMHMGGVVVSRPDILVLDA